jgi:hypothetical protein
MSLHRDVSSIMRLFAALALVVVASFALPVAADATEALPPISASQPSGPVYDYTTTTQQLQATPSAQIAGVTPQAASEENPLTYNGGYVQKRPYVHVIFWGSEWNSRPGDKEKLLGLYRAFSGGGYGRLLSQYFDQTGYIGGEVDLSSYTDSTHPAPTSPPNQTEIKEEVERSMQSQGWTKSYENQYVVFTPPSTPVPNPQLFCGYHQWGGGALEMAYTYIPFASEGCRRGLEPWGSMQVSASHEFAETATDPIPQENYWGWVTATEGGEIADLCNTREPSERSEIAPGIYAAKLSDDYQKAKSGVLCQPQDTAPQRFEVHVGTTASIGRTEATLTGSVSTAGWGTYYDFELEAPGGTITRIPARTENGSTFYGFSSAGTAFGSIPVSAKVTGLSENSPYSVRLVATGVLVSPSVPEKRGHPIVFNGGQSTFQTLPPPPAATTATPSGVQLNGATASGSVNPRGAATSYYFEYGPSPAFGSKTAAGSAGSGKEAVPVSQTLTGLEYGREYSVRLVATNAGGTSYGATQHFTPGGWRTVENSALNQEYRFSSVSCASATKCFAVGSKRSGGSQPTIAVWSGGSWTVAGVPFPEEWDEGWLGTVSCGSPSSCIAVGQMRKNNRESELREGVPLVESWNGTAWSYSVPVTRAPGNETVLSGVSCVSSSACTAVGSATKYKISQYGYNEEIESTPYVRRWNGSTWTTLPGPAPTDPERCHDVVVERDHLETHDAPDAGFGL